MLGGGLYISGPEAIFINNIIIKNEGKNGAGAYISCDLVYFCNNTAAMNTAPQGYHDIEFTGDKTEFKNNIIWGDWASSPFGIICKLFRY